MAFGLSGSEISSQMEGADVAVAYLDSIRGYVVDYNITAKAPVCKCKECNYVCVIMDSLLKNNSFSILKSVEKFLVNTRESVETNYLVVWITTSCTLHLKKMELLL